MSFTTQGTHATLPSTGFDPGSDTPGEVSPHATECSHAHRAKLAEVGVSAQVHADLAHEVTRLRETLAQIQSALTAVQTHLKVLEQYILGWIAIGYLDPDVSGSGTAAFFGASAST